jgi:DNA-binding transcriptional ArsR family regulator
MKTTNQYDIFRHQVQEIGKLSRAGNHSLRSKILNFLTERKNVTDIYIALRIEQSVASQNLAILRRAGLVKTTREGKKIYYEANAKLIQTVNEMYKMLE